MLTNDTQAPSPLAVRIFVGALATLGAAVLASRAGTFLHEVGGHLAMAAALGGKPILLQVTLLSGGVANSRFPVDPGPRGHAAVMLAGIVVQTVVGLLATLALVRRAPGGAADLCARVFACVCVVGGVHYAVRGSYYGEGDPAAWRWLWKPALALAVPLCALAARPAIAWIAARVVGAEARFGRRLVAAAILGALVGGGYYGLTRLLAQEDDHASRMFREERRQSELADAREEKRARIAAERDAEARARESRGEPVSEDLRRPPRPEEVEPRPEEVRKPFPVEVPLIACYVLAALLGLAPRGRPADAVRAGDAAVALLLGAAALGAVWPIAHGANLTWP
jgi:hypothetical protein